MPMAHARIVMHSWRMLSTHTTDGATPKNRWSKLPDADGQRALDALGLTGMTRRVRPHRRTGHYKWFIGRLKLLSVLGRIVADHGPIAARMCADAIQAEIDAGNEPTTREAIIIAKLAASNLTKPRTAGGSA
jgi:hypothetical protein